jgi:hypothetical protein
MRILPRAYRYFGASGDVVSKDKFYQLFKRVDVDDAYFTVERFKPGTSGETDLVEFLRKAIFG